MASRCDHMREAALEQGLDSTAGRVWRLHARECANCRTELFILQSLHRQASENHRHISKDDLALLQDEVLTRKRRAHSGGGASLLMKVACVWILFAGILAIQRFDSVPPPRRSAGTVSVFFRHRLPLPASTVAGATQGESRQAVSGSASDRLVASSAPDPVERQLRDVRKRLLHKRDELIQLVGEDQISSAETCRSPFPY